MAETDDRPRLVPGPDHPIEIAETPVQVTVTAADTRLADRAGALELREADYPPVLYVKPGHVDRARLIPSEHRTWCPYKGEASYFHIMLESGGRLNDAAWCYREPRESVAPIRDHIAFYPDRVDVMRV